MTVRAGHAGDRDAIIAIDGYAEVSAQRRAAIDAALAAGLAVVLEADGAVVGYGVLHHQFFEHSCVALLYLVPEQRGRGHGPRMLDALLQRAVTPRVFTSTNASNAHMQHVLAKAGWQRCGTVDHLDPGDPEWIYSLDRPQPTDPDSTP